MSTSNARLRKGACCGFAGLTFLKTPAPVVTKNPPPQAPVVTKQLRLGGTKGRQAHSMHINFFNTLLNVPPSARIHHSSLGIVILHVTMATRDVAQDRVEFFSADASTLVHGSCLPRSPRYKEIALDDIGELDIQ
uniref:AlNc14C133G7006 protein n=1 Tax=Albugo laibachii Nc14 TaxID=890382 RepID=F0WKF4_9STRA|nr:AlNc14C133G7006 [Albugo laibachii Nc14]|eukprot:CCA21758.1 AlNc14C133G7006 [Albugo laibachii Nc14]